jgi:thiamine pyrophosphokinase
LLRSDDVLIAVDGGSRHLQRMGLQPAILIGDLDSVSPEEAARLEAAGVRVARYPAHKDETDLELGLNLAVAEGHEDILVLGALGGRLDQTLGNLNLLAGPLLAGRQVRLDDGLQEVFLITQSALIQGSPGDLVSLLPLTLEVTGVVTEGLEYPLRAETLFSYRTRGISNVLAGESARVTISQGALLCIHIRRTGNL